jgi:formamidopyrimidine-DNA glycosylase
MPELPEVENIVRVLRDGIPSLVGAHIADLMIVWDGVVSAECRQFDLSVLKGYTFAEASRVGKYLIFRLVSRDCPTVFMIVHLRMTGRLSLLKGSDAIERHTRLAVLLENGFSLRFDDPRKFGRVWFVNDPAQVVGGLGPDALTVNYPDFVACLARHNRQIKPLLLDQNGLAGIGNIYADESLFRAGIHPLTVSSDLSGEEVLRLHAAVISVLEEAVASNGANIDGVFKAGQFVVSVYGREGAPCRICGTEISKIRVGQRGTHFCRTCQHKSG